MEQKNKYTVIDLFAGCGGLSLGLYQSGWNGVFAVEKNPCAFSTLKFNLIDKCNHFDWPSWLKKDVIDIVDLNKKYKNELKQLRGQIDLVAGGPPCQGFSLAGKRVEDDIRNQLVFSYIDFIDLVRPKMLLFENVKGFTCSFNRDNSDALPYSTIVEQKLKELGYNVDAHVIDFSAYGVPQRRKRFILMGILQDDKKKSASASEFFSQLEAKRSLFLQEKGLDLYCTVEDAISDLFQSNGETDTPDRKGFKSSFYGKPISAFQRFVRKGVTAKIPNSHSFPHHTNAKKQMFVQLLANYPVKGKRIDGEARAAWGIKQRGLTILDPKQVAPTLTNMPDDYLHYSEPRILTVREYARIQSFPDWYEFKSKYTTGGDMRKKEVPRYSQIGNAIPPLFAEQVGIVLKEML